MTREEVIKFGNMWLEINEDSKNSRTYAFFQIAIKALEQESCEDAISRQAVLEKLRTCYDTETKEYSDGSQWINYEDAVAEMENLPPVTPQPKTGHWIFYCPHCGVRMVEPQESEEEV